MPLEDAYNSFTELARQEKEGVDFVRRIVERNSRVAIVAPHGGGIEPGTSEVAQALANDVFSLYTFEGLNEDNSQRLHVTSHRFDDPACIELLRRSQVAVVVHGCNEKQAAVHLGGLHTNLKKRLARALVEAGFEARLDTGRYPGRHGHNLCNLAAMGKGVQIELSLGLRRRLFASLRRSDRNQRTPEFNQLVMSIQTILCDLEDKQCRKFS